MKYTIRNATPADDVIIARILSSADPRRPVVPEQLASSRQKTLNSPLDLHLSQWLALVDGVPVGFLGIAQWAGWYHPDRYMLQLAVCPNYTQQGLGSVLADLAQKHLQEREARQAFAWAYEDAPHAVQFAEQRGFNESSREVTSMLKVSEFEWANWRHKLTLGTAYTRLDYPQFVAQYGEQQALEAFTVTYNEGRFDQPHSIQPRPYTWQEVQQHLGHPSFFPEGIQLAVTATGEVAALSELWLDLADSSRLHTGLTTTRRQHRRQGIALALKLAGIRAAQQHGISHLYTDNDATNIGMLNINNKLGFMPQPAMIEFIWGDVQEEKK